MFFYTLRRKFICRHKIIKKTKVLIYQLLRSAVLCEGPCGEQRGKALSGASISERSSQSYYKEGTQQRSFSFSWIGASFSLWCLNNLRSSSLAWQKEKPPRLLSAVSVPRTRLELTRANAHYPLKVACLPIPPPGL